MAPVTHPYWVRKFEKLLGGHKKCEKISNWKDWWGHLIPFLVTDPTEQVNNSSVPVPLRTNINMGWQTTCWNCITSFTFVSLTARLHDGPHKCGERTREGSAWPQPALCQHLQWYVLWIVFAVFQKEILLKGSLIRPFGLKINISMLETGAASVPSMSHSFCL